MIFQGGTAEAQALPGIQIAGRLRGLAGGVLDVLRFVEHQDVQGLSGQALDILGQQRIGGEDQVVVGQVIEVFFARGAIQRQDLELGREVRGFVEPVGNQAGGHHHHARPVEAPGVLLGQHVGQGLQGLAQSHVVRQDPADFQLPQRLHPAQAFQLVGAQRRVETDRGLGAVVLDVPQALGEGADVLAAFPQQWQVFQWVEARGIGAAQAQAGFAGFLQVELTQGRQYRLQAAERQCHLQRSLLGIGAVGNVHQDQLIVTAPGQAFRVEDLGVRAHQVQQDRQQAQALAVDDDP